MEELRQNSNPIPISSQRAILQRTTDSEEVAQLRSDLLRAQRALHEVSVDLRRQRAGNLQELAMVVHGLRNPAGSILSAIEYVVEDASGVLGNEHKALLRGAAQSTMVILQMIDNILEFSRSECGKSIINFTPSSLVSVAKDVVALNRSRAERRGIELRTYFEPPVPTVDLDPQKMMQVIDNLISNAIRFSESGHIVELRSGANESHTFLSIRDQGPGITPERLKTIFEPFQRGQRRSGFSDAGGGLGLAISKRIVDLHSGIMEVKSRVGYGSEFTILLPLRKQAVAKRFEKAAG